MKELLQPWVKELPLMQQTVLMTAVRGPDGIPKYGPVKMLQRWYRRCVLVSSLDGIILETPYHPDGGSFMGPSLSPNAFSPGDEWEPGMNVLVSEYLQQVDALPHHFQLHFMHAAEIVGYKHSDLRIRKWWRLVYYRLVKDMHLRPEIEHNMDERLGDDRAGWLRHADPATTD